MAGAVVVVRRAEGIPIFESSTTLMVLVDFTKSCQLNIVQPFINSYPLEHMEIKSVNPKGNQPWIFIGRTDADAEAPILWPPDAKNCLIGKDPNAGKDWRQKEKGVSEDEMVGRHHQLHGHEFEQTPGNGKGQGSLACCSLGSLRVRQNLATEQHKGNDECESVQKSLWDVP